MVDPSVHCVPHRVVLWIRSDNLWDERQIIQDYFKQHDIAPHEDYFSHVKPSNSSSKRAYIVLDVHCKAVPDVDVYKVEHKVYRVRKAADSGYL